VINLLIFSLILIELILRLSSAIGIKRILADKLKIALMFHPFLEYEIIFDGGLLLADPLRIDLIEADLPSCLSLSYCCFFYRLKSAWSSDLTN
jgi:hypothetical protein